jgi:hypothetical protein
MLGRLQCHGSIRRLCIDARNLCRLAPYQSFVRHSWPIDRHDRQPGERSVLKARELQQDTYGRRAI